MIGKFRTLFVEIFIKEKIKNVKKPKQGLKVD